MKLLEQCLQGGEHSALSHLWFNLGKQHSKKYMLEEDNFQEGFRCYDNLKDEIEKEFLH